MDRTEYYRTKDGNADYKFSFEEQPDGKWRAYIEDQPSYGERATDVHSTHRHRNGSRYYVCWTEPLESLEDAEKVSAMWADATQEYIKNGTRF
jgi:hypothetical protein